MSDPETQLPSAVLFRSFLLVAGSYMINLMLMIAAAVILLFFAFPDSLEIINSDPERYEAIFEAEPEKVFPPEYLWILLGVSCLVSFVCGYFVARLAPVAEFSHAIFLAAILFVHYLQFAIGATDSLQRMFVLFMAASPVAVILGANMFLSRTSNQEPEL